jgi:hypothetical protein
MKTRFLSLLVIMLISFSATMAEPKDDVKPNLPTAAAKLLEKKISYPLKAEYSKISGSVVFELRKTQNDQLEFVPLASDNKILSTSVEKQVKRMKSQLSEVMEPGESQQFKLNFQLPQN